MLRNRGVLLAGFLVLFLVIPIYVFRSRGARPTPKGQQSLVGMSAAMLPVFQEDFNNSADKGRLIVFLSAVDNRVPEAALNLHAWLEANSGTAWKVFVIWEPFQSTGQTLVEPPPARALAALPDTRIAQFWDPQKVIAGAVAYPPAPGRHRGRYLLYAPDQRWTSLVPAPVAKDELTTAGMTALERAAATLSLPRR